jgi:hypothetical protein
MRGLLPDATAYALAITFLAVAPALGFVGIVASLYRLGVL